MALEYTAFGMILGHRGQTPQNGICVFIQEASDSSLASFILWIENKKAPFVRNAPSEVTKFDYTCLDLGSPISTIMRNKFLLLPGLPGLRYFIIAASID